MANLDHLLHFRHAADGQIPPECIGRFLCTKLSWRGKYRRILCITTAGVTTQHPDSLTITNQWEFTGDADIDGVSASVSTAEEQEFALSVRQDKKVRSNARLVFSWQLALTLILQQTLCLQSKFKLVKFTCKQQSSLITMLYSAIAMAAAHGQCPIATKILG